MGKLMEHLQKLTEVAETNLGFLLLSTGIVAAVIISAYVAEFLIAKKRGLPRLDSKFKTQRLVIIAMLSAISVVLMLFFKFPLGFVPSFYKLDFSELPVIIGAFTLGPVAGITIELIKIVMNVLINGSDTAFVGELANFLIGCSFIIPASFFYFLKKNKRNAIIGLGVGTFIAAFLGGVLNAYVLLPKYAELFHWPLNEIIGAGTEKNSAIQGMFTFVMFAVVPFNLIKFIAVSAITMLIYKPISHILRSK